MNTYKLKSGIFLLAFVAAAILYHMYEQDNPDLKPLTEENTYVDLKFEDQDESAVDPEEESEENR